MKKNIYLISELNKNKGLGHLMRLNYLSEYFKKK